ncbi:MAG: AraC family transcriptional regulator ligand-binding domain-containing protein [Pseudomonadota bacterium]
MRGGKRTEADSVAGQAVHVDIASGTVAFAMSRGMALAEIQQATGLELERLGDPDARLPDDVAPRLWTALIERSGGTVTLTVEAARAAPFALLGGIVHGLQYAATLHEALSFLVQNQSVLADRLSLRIETHGDRVLVIGNHPNDVLDHGRTSEVGVMLVIRVIREVLGQGRALAGVEIYGEPLGPAAEYEAFLRVPVSFATNQTMLVIRRAAMDEQVPGHNAELFAFVDEHFRLVRTRLANAQHPPVFARLLRAIGDGAATGDYRASTAAGRAELSLRSARRVAAAQGTTLHTMIEEARRANAEELLGDTAMSIETVATLLGYSDDRAFRRAFKRWTGRTPSAFRRAAK